MIKSKHISFIALLVIILVSCAPMVLPVPTTTLMPVPPTPTATLEVAPVSMTPSPMPTQPTFAIITPDAIQVERWKEYQTALARKFMSFLPPEEVLCEWEILGQSSQKVYVWAACAGTIATTSANGLFPKGEEPAVILLGIDGTVQNVEIPGAGTDYGPDIRRLFPPDVQGKIFNNLIDEGQLLDHLEWRRAHPEEPPWIVLLATPAP